ncbi:hypothetical protein BJ165DRAFT_1597534 [Panaeolus papilionaceus]|nr:hypothetical protein BJ165DRAFT_1597534 [Panaeolus papilionaceus]
MSIQLAALLVPTRETKSDLHRCLRDLKCEYGVGNCVVSSRWGCGENVLDDSTLSLVTGSEVFTRSQRAHEHERNPQETPFKLTTDSEPTPIDSSAKMVVDFTPGLAPQALEPIPRHPTSELMLNQSGTSLGSVVMSKVDILVSKLDPTSIIQLGT